MKNKNEIKINQITTVKEKIHVFLVAFKKKVRWVGRENYLVLPIGYLGQ
jgi:hypothetical protein